MHTPLTVATDQARTDWLAGDASAWTRYRTCVLQARALKDTRADRLPPRQPVRPLGPRARA